MPKSELHTLEKIIGGLAPHAAISGNNSTLANDAEWVNTIVQECKRIKDGLTHELFTSAKEQSIFRYIQYHQAGITQLSNELHRHFPVPVQAGDKKYDTSQLQDHVLNKLEQLLHFLKHNCYRYFDADYDLTIYNCRRQSDKIAGFKAEMLSYEGSDVDVTLIKAVGDSIQDELASVTISGISYRQVDHILKLLSMVHQRMHLVEGTTTDKLALALYQQNLNSLHMCNWYQEHFRQNLGKISTAPEQRAFLDEQIKIFSTIFVEPENAFEPELPSIDQVILPWLREKAGIPVNNTKNTLKGNDNGQIPLNLSVPQFAMFIRIFYKTGCFPAPNISKLTRFFAGHFTTKKQPHISIKSFARAFYSLDQSAAAVVRDYLQKMINYLDKTYFP